jgi:hypothetical protein
VFYERLRLLTAIRIIVSSVFHSGFETTDWLSTIQEADVIALVDGTKIGDVAPEYKVLDGVVGVSKGDVIGVGVKWPTGAAWPLPPNTGRKHLLFAARKPYDFEAVSLNEDALPFLISEQKLPASTELQSLNEYRVVELMADPCRRSRKR